MRGFIHRCVPECLYIHVHTKRRPDLTGEWLQSTIAGHFVHICLEPIFYFEDTGMCVTATG